MLKTNMSDTQEKSKAKLKANSYPMTIIPIHLPFPGALTCFAINVTVRHNNVLSKEGQKGCV